MPVVARNMSFACKQSLSRPQLVSTESYLASRSRLKHMQAGYLGVETETMQTVSIISRSNEYQQPARVLKLVLSS